MSEIDIETLRRLHQAALLLGLAPERDTLLVGIDKKFVSGLPRTKSATAQILCDLDAMRAAGALADGTRPLVEWLKTALQLTSSRSESAIFTEVLARCDAADAAETADSGAATRRDPPLGAPPASVEPKPGSSRAPPPISFSGGPDSQGPSMSSSRGHTPVILNPFGDGDVAAEVKILPDLYFVDTDFSRKAQSDKINLIIGRRGAGKSALAHWLGFTREGGSRYYRVYVNLCTPSVFAPAVTNLAEKLKAENHAKETLSQAWVMALLHALMVETLKDKPMVDRAGSFDMDAHLKRWLIPQNQTAGHVVQRVFQILANGVSAGGSIVVAAVSEKLRSLGAEPGFSLWRRVLPEYLKAGRYRAVIVVDTLEEYHIKDPAIQLFLASLSHAVSTLSKDLASEGVEIKLFLPAEVAQSLEETAILNIGKTFDRAMFMHWRRKDLLRLMCWRLMYHLTRTYPSYCPPKLNRYRELDWSDHSTIAEHIWNEFFPEHRVSGHAVDTFAYISRYTQLRPRQFVLLANAIAQKAHENGNFPKISWEDVGAGIADVVDTLAAEVLSSYRDVHGQASKVIRTLATVRDVRSLCSGLTYGNVDSLAAQVKGHCTHEDFWRLLLETGALGVVTQDSGFYTEARFEYIVRQRLIPNVNDLFVVHPMFYERLGIRPSPSSKPVFPIGPEDLTVHF